MISHTTFTATFEEIQRAHLVIDDVTGQRWYQVENSRGETDDDNNIIEYVVRYDSKNHRFTCSCKAGQAAFSTCFNKTGYCQHVRISVAAAREDRKEVRASRVAEANDIEATPEYQREYAEYQDEQAQRCA